MILVIDNYDSFVYNLSRYFEELGKETQVVRNSEISIQEVTERRPEAIVLSPGPSEPCNAGVTVPLIQALSGAVPILGVCLGHQAIAQAFGARVVPSGRPVHGMASAIHHDGKGLFEDLPSPFSAGRYHSLIVDPESLPSELEVSAVSVSDGEGESVETIMGLRHLEHPTVGVQFHPESILTAGGHQILTNFLKHYVTDRSRAASRDHDPSRAEVP